MELGRELVSPKRVFLLAAKIYPIAEAMRVALRMTLESMTTAMPQHLVSVQTATVAELQMEAPLVVLPSGPVATLG